MGGAGAHPRVGRRGRTALDRIADAIARFRLSSSLVTVSRFAVPVCLWMIFVNVASHYRDAGRLPDDALADVVQAELATRRCPGLRLDPAGFHEYARAHGINHADLYQKRSPHLQKVAERLDRALRADTETQCQRMIELYETAAPHLIKPVQALSATRS
ncbi:hypothetical protein [Methylobacterium sp. J-067]|uniref:hypothetical protein n=1 Tax=Methylobacterium sp. J-067 TaxID=2836648 RepID=UPI001FBB868D|nr:hypothetical protein [Methylobacterium sp. J-067]MCJ2023441.1 hypothetical protein [Methylobacterium sp. J-067]